MIWTFAKITFGLLALWLFALAAIGLSLQAQQYERKQHRDRVSSPAIGPIVQPAPRHTSQLATVSTGCVADHYVMD